jgi:sugar phosphate isomerase/epimerase
MLQNSTLNRRSFFAAGLGSALALRGATSKAPKVDRTRISAISDEVSRSPAEAIQFAKHYGMQWLSLRDVPGTKKSYHSMEPDELAAVHAELKEAGIRVSFLDAPLLKFGLPGTEPFRAQDQARYDARMDDLHKAVRCCHALEVTNLRTFSFTRVAQPETVFQRVADHIGEMAKVTEKEGVRLLIENEYSQNVGTCAETAKFLKLLPEKTLAINWDSLNGAGLGEHPFPEGYDLLPKHRIMNVHLKGKSVLDYPEHLDWGAIFTQMQKDGYTGRFELETHVFSDGQIAASHASMREIMRIIDTL